MAIDEADRLIDEKNFQEVHKIVHLMNDSSKGPAARSNRQTFVFSATLTMVHKLPARIQAGKNPKVNNIVLYAFSEYIEV